MYSYILYISFLLSFYSIFFFFNDTATTEIYTLSLHDALPIYAEIFPGIDDIDQVVGNCRSLDGRRLGRADIHPTINGDRKSTRLNSSHPSISYAVFCLKKKKKKKISQKLTKNNTINKSPSNS